MPNLFDIRYVFLFIREIAKFIPITLELALKAGILGLIVGFLLALIRIKRIPVLYEISVIYISFMRGTPIVIQLYMSYFGIPILLKYINYYYDLNLKVANIPPIIYAITALGLNVAAFNAIVMQSAYEAINKGEIEAASALGMTGTQKLIRIIIPEAIELALPNLGNQFIGLLKGTSLAFSCAVVEMTAQGKILGARGYRYFEAYVALAILYWLITICLELLIKWIMHFYKVPDVVSHNKAQ